MVDQRYVAFIEALIQQTKGKKLNWRYLDREETLCEEMGWVKTNSIFGPLVGTTGSTTPDFDTENSFCVNVSGTYVVLYVWNNQPAKLYVIPSTFKKVATLTPEEYGEHITRLLNLVQSLFPSAEAFIDTFLARKT